MSKSTRIYMDYAASVSPNPSSIHSSGVEVKRKLENSRAKVASILGARTKEIIFTSGGTESNNLAIQGVVFASKVKGLPHIVTTNIEHASVLETYKMLEKRKLATISIVPVEMSGIVDPKKIKKALTKNTVLVSVMYANNEIGTIQPIKEIAKEIRHFKKRQGRSLREFPQGPSLPFFHTDATQAINYLPIKIPQLGVDLMSFNSAKIYGPKGVGVLYVKKGTPVSKIMFGGDQERGLRPGTENVEGATALANALDAVEKIKEKEVKRLTKLRDYFINQLQHSHILKNVGMLVNGDLKNRLPNNINITIPNIPSDLLVIELSAKGIMASAKSACKSGDGKASHVVQAINKNTRETDGSIRFSFGRDTTKADIDHTLKALSQILTKLNKWYY